MDSRTLAAATFSTRSDDDVLTSSDQMRELLKYAARVASGDVKVLITGESGVGKDVIARYIHAHSARRDREYVVVNCAGITESLLESELFGHVKGSFTGAYRDKRGKLQIAHGGTLFLDELGEMTPRMQGLLLRFLENGEVQSVGADTATTTVNVRVIAATNRNLAERVAAGAFREDLFYRLCVVHITVPPLRDRAEDVQTLGTYFLDRSKRRTTLTRDAWTVLEKYPWPGNIRQLQNVMEQITWLASPGEPVTVAQLPAIVTGSETILTPAPERRRQLADELFDMIRLGGHNFWEPVHRLFLARDITRHDVRELVRQGLRVTHGNYRGVPALFNIPESDYKKFMNFLCTHDCRPDFREFRSPAAGSQPRVSRRKPWTDLLSAPPQAAVRRLRPIGDQQDVVIVPAKPPDPATGVEGR
jgi:transcriptional regulator with GAF, ATPase, and Fis domain